MHRIEWLKRPSVIFVAVILGALIGIYNKPLAFMIAPFGDMFLSFLKMLVIPIMITAVVSSLGRLLASRDAAAYLKRIIVIFLIGLTLASCIGLMIGLVGDPGSGLNKTTRTVLGETVMQSERQGGADAGQESESASGLIDVLKMLIPSNIFAALQGGENLQVLFFSIVFGVAVGTLSADKNEKVLTLFEATFKAFEKMISWTMYGLPIGLLCIIASQIAQTGIDLILAMTRFIFLIYVAAMLLIFLSGIVIWKVTKRSVWASTRDLKESLFIAFGTRNSLATMPSIMKTLREKYELKESSVNLVVPLSIIICRYSMVLIFSIGTVFVAQMYNFPLNLDGIIIALVGAIAAAVAGAGAPVVVSLSMMSLVLGPLGLPSATAVVLFLAITPVIDPILTMLNVHLACSTTILVDRPHGEKKAPEKVVQPA